MSTDIATLGIKIYSSDAKTAETNLDNLTASGKQAEQQTKELSQAAKVLNETHSHVNTTVGRVNTTLRGTGAAAKLTASEALNLSRQMVDVGVTAAMGMNPFMILVQQGPQIADIMKTSGLGVRGIFVELGLMVGVLKRVEVATAETAVAQAAQAATANAAATAEARLAVATGAAADAAGLASAGAASAAAANLAMGTTATAAGAATAVAIAPLGVILLGIAAAAVAVGSIFTIAFKSIKDNVGDVTKGMGLTEKQMERLKDKGVSTTVTMGDAFKGFFQTVGDRFVSAFGPQIEWVKKAFSNAYEFIKNATVGTIKLIVGTFTGAFFAIRATWALLPAAIGDIVMQAANATVKGIEYLVNGAIDRLNALSSLANTVLPATMQIGKLGNVKMGDLNNPYAGAASKAATGVSGAFAQGYQEGGASVDRFGADWEKNSRSNAEKSGKKSNAKSEYDNQVKAAQQYIEGLKNETAEIGKNRIEVKMMAAERAAALAPTQKLKDEIMASALAWKEATAAQATGDFKRQLQAQIEAEQFEISLIGKNVKEREIAIATHELEMKVRDLAREGIVLSADAIASETAAIQANASARGQMKLDVDNAKEYSAAMNDVNDALRDMAEGFGEVFGTAGEGFENLINEIADYGDKVAEIHQRITEATASGNEQERQRASEQLSRAQIKHYGDMLGAAKTFFKEGTTGYKVMEAAERAYRLYQMISFAMDIANKARAIATDTAHTASSVANSGTRAAADGVAAIAKAIASLPFPLNLIAGAATAAALVAFGVKLFGGGGGAGASASTAAVTDTSSNTDTGPGYSASMTSPYSTLPGSGGLYDPKNAGRNGTSPLASANDNSYASNNTVGGTSGSSFTYAPTINAPNAEPGTVQQIQDMLQSHQAETVAIAREFAAQDRFNIATRQRIGNG